MKGISKKLSFYYKFVLKGPICDNSNEDDSKNSTFNDPIYKLLNNMEEILSIKDSEKEGFYKFLYFNWKRCSDILYEKDSVIELNSSTDNNGNINNNRLSDYFYLNLMMKEEVTDFEYSPNFIKRINDIQEAEKIQNLKKLMLLKIILKLIKCQENNEFNEDIKTDNITIYLEEFNDILNCNDENCFNEIKIDEIYASILVILIKNNRFENYDYASSIFEQLDYENIDMTNTIFQNLKSTLDTKEDYINNYKIKDFIEIFNNNTKINFYYLLYKYILKNPFYIYQIDFLIDFKKVIINSLKSKSEDIRKELNNPTKSNIKEKIIFIINSYTDSNYYYDEFISLLYKRITTKSDSKDTKNENTAAIYEEKIRKLLENDSFEIDFNNEDNIISDDILNKLNLFKSIKLEEITIEKLKKSFKKFQNNIYSIIKEITNIKKIANNNIIFECITQQNIEKNYYPYDYITCDFNLFKNENDFTKVKLTSFHSDNILEKGILKTKGFLYLVKYLKKYIQKCNLEATQNLRNSLNSSFSSSVSSNTFSEENQDKVRFFKFKYIKHYLKKENKYKILSLERIIYQHPHEAEYIKEICNDNFISVGFKNDISMYNSNFKKVKFKMSYLEDKKENQNQNEGKNENKNENENKTENKSISKAQIINLSQRSVDYIIFSKEDPKIEIIRQKRDEASNKLFDMKDNVSLLRNTNNIKLIKTNDRDSNDECLVAGGIQIGGNEAVVTSNSVLFNGQDKIFNYNLEKRSITEIKINGDYSFTLSNQSLLLMPNEKGIKKFLLCGCTKYKSNQKNGVLVIDFKPNGLYDSHFYETDDFEVYCFCPITIEEIKNSNNDGKNENKIIKRTASTNYFFAGGFDVNKRKGAIKLFRLKMNDKKILCEIEFVEDVVFEDKKIPKLVITREKIYDSNSKKDKYTENEKIEDYYFTGFQRNISSIFQTKKTRKILITCWDGNVYLFSEPNISSYLEEERNNNKY